MGWLHDFFNVYCNVCDFAPLPAQTLTSVCSGSHANTNARTQWEVFSVFALQGISWCPMVKHAEVLYSDHPTTLRFIFEYLCNEIFIKHFRCSFFLIFELCTISDIDECTEHSVQCGANQMCFNTRGSYQCLDTPCPSSYHRGRSPGSKICFIQINSAILKLNHVLANESKSIMLVWVMKLKADSFSYHP